MKKVRWNGQNGRRTCRVPAVRSRITSKSPTGRPTVTQRTSTTRQLCVMSVQSAPNATCSTSAAVPSNADCDLATSSQLAPGIFNISLKSIESNSNQIQNKKLNSKLNYKLDFSFGFFGFIWKNLEIF